MYLDARGGSEHACEKKSKNHEEMYSVCLANLLKRKADKVQEGVQRMPLKRSQRTMRCVLSQPAQKNHAPTWARITDTAKHNLLIWQ